MRNSPSDERLTSVGKNEVCVLIIVVVFFKHALMLPEEHELL